MKKKIISLCIIFTFIFIIFGMKSNVNARTIQPRKELKFDCPTKYKLVTNWKDGYVYVK
ncbi:hypothetical protein [Mycoplasma sp. P36-A1]|uniref:hypothetical protein n=1 Tax=Mycoplasma sp. P36-A1 TaxID=3252900 RepID=UPI003C2D5507